MFQSLNRDIKALPETTLLCVCIGMRVWSHLTQIKARQTTAAHSVWPQRHIVEVFVVCRWLSPHLFEERCPLWGQQQARQMSALVWKDLCIYCACVYVKCRPCFAACACAHWDVCVVSVRAKWKTWTHTRKPRTVQGRESSLSCLSALSLSLHHSHTHSQSEFLLFSSLYETYSWWAISKPRGPGLNPHSVWYNNSSEENVTVFILCAPCSPAVWVEWRWEKGRRHTSRPLPRPLDSPDPTPAASAGAAAASVSGKKLLYYNYTILCCAALCCAILYSMVQYYTVLYYAILCHALLCHTIQYYTVLYYTIVCMLCCAVPYRTILL